MIEKILQGESDELKSEIEDIHNEFLMSNKPLNFAGERGIEAKQIKDFEQVCIFIASKINRDAKKMTVIEFYTALEMIEQEAKKK